MHIHVLFQNVSKLVVILVWRRPIAKRENLIQPNNGRFFATGSLSTWRKISVLSPLLRAMFRGRKSFANDSRSTVFPWRPAPRGW